jgi:hypothetical protein
MHSQTETSLSEELPFNDSARNASPTCEPQKRPKLLGNASVNLKLHSRRTRVPRIYHKCGGYPMTTLVRQEKHPMGGEAHSCAYRDRVFR